LSQPARQAAIYLERDELVRRHLGTVTVLGHDLRAASRNLQPDRLAQKPTVSNVIAAGCMTCHLMAFRTTRWPLLK